MCPYGTVPIRRTLDTDVKRASSLERFGQKKPHMSIHSKVYNGDNYTETKEALITPSNTHDVSF